MLAAIKIIIFGTTSAAGGGIPPAVNGDLLLHDGVSFFLLRDNDTNLHLGH